MTEEYAAISLEDCTLRDYFASCALQGILSAFHDEHNRSLMMLNASKNGLEPKAQVARAAYEYADAMMKSRGESA